MKISVSMCTYNGSEFLRNQLESIILQTHKVDEIVISDDNSSDSTMSIICDYEKRYPGLISLYSNSENVGYVRNFEKCISKCTGDVIFLCDQDDIWDSTKVEEIIKVFQEDNTVFYVFSDGDLIDENGKKLGQSLWKKARLTTFRLRSLTCESSYKLLLKRNFVTGATLAIRREAKQFTFPFCEDVTHDHWIVTLLALHNKKGAPMNRRLISYRVHEGQNIGFSSLSLSSVFSKRGTRGTASTYLRLLSAIRNRDDFSSLRGSARLEVDKRLRFFSGIEDARSSSTCLRVLFLLMNLRRQYHLEEF